MTRPPRHLRGDLLRRDRHDDRPDGDRRHSSPRSVAVLLVLGKTLAVSLAAFLTGNGLRRAVQAGLSLSQIGEFAFIVIGVGISAGVVRGFLLPVVVGASCITAITGTWQIRASDRFASWLAAHLPHPVQTFVSFYEAWIARLRTAPRPETSWSRLRRPTIMLVIDTVMLGAVAIGAAELHATLVARIARWSQLDEHVVLAVFAIVAVTVAGLFALGLARGAGRLAWLLATTMIPHAPAGAPDLGHSPRRALVLTLELAIVLVLGVPLAVVVQPEIPGGGLIVLALVAVLAIATRRSISDFDEHVRAGSSLIVEVLGRQTADAGPPGLAEAHALLPGFEGLTPIALPAASAAVGKTLAELDLRAATGASVLAIGRTGGGTANPSPTEPLRAGDILALAGSADAIAAARVLLES